MKLAFIGDIALLHNTELKIDTSLEDCLGFNFEYALLATKSADVIYAEGKPIVYGDLNPFEKINSNIFAVCLANNHLNDCLGSVKNIFNLAQLLPQKIYLAGTLDTNPCLCDGQWSFACYCHSGLINESNITDPDHKIAPINEVQIQKDIQIARKNGSMFHIVELHWGSEFMSTPWPAQQKLARSILDAGADIIIGHHPHCTQPYEVYKGKYIFYSLGNAIFHDIDAPAFYSNGKPRMAWRNYWMRYNQTSIMVTIDTETKKVSCKGLYFDGKTLTDKISFKPVNFIGDVQQPKWRNAVFRRLMNAFYSNIIRARKIDFPSFFFVAKICLKYYKNYSKAIKSHK